MAKDRDILLTGQRNPDGHECLTGCYEQSWAVVIGINDYQHVEALGYARADADAMASALADVGFPSDHVFTLMDGQATRQNIQDLLSGDLARQVGPNDRLLVFFAGHGQDHTAPSGRKMGYFVPVDGNPEYLASRCISMGDVELWSDLIPAKHILYVMDCCYSGLAATREAGLKPQHANYIAEITRRPVRQIITAGRADERVIEDAGHGVFTRALVRALRGDADLAGRGFVTGFDLGHYLQTRVYEESGYRQQPQFRYLRGDGEFLVLCPPAGSSPSPQVARSEEQGAFPPLRKTSAARPPARKSSSQLPDFLEPVADARYARLGGLNAGSEAAQQRQMALVEKGYPLEAVMKETGIVFRLVPPGEFQMGASPDDSEAFDAEKPQHKVIIPSPIYVAKFPVTQQQWQVVMGTNPAFFQTGRRLEKAGIFKHGKELAADTKEYPVERVSWEDCQAYLDRVHDRLNMESGKAIRLPTEAEWEYACRAGTIDSREYGAPNAISWLDERSGSMTHPVGQKRPNAWGLHDMIGNVYEWCEDTWHDEKNSEFFMESYYLKDVHILDGYSIGPSLPLYCRSSYRFSSYYKSRFSSPTFDPLVDVYWMMMTGPDDRIQCGDLIGFRVVVDLA